MITRLTAHLRSNLVAYLALFVALGGTAMAGSQYLKGVSGDGTLQMRQLDLKDTETGTLANSSFARLRYDCNNGEGRLILRNTTNGLLSLFVESAEDGIAASPTTVQPEGSEVIDSTPGGQSDRVIATAQDIDKGRMIFAVVTVQHGTLAGSPVCRIVGMTGFRS